MGLHPGPKKWGSGAGTRLNPTLDVTAAGYYLSSMARRAPRRVPVVSATSVKIPAATKSRVKAAAADAGLTTHAFLLRVIEEAADRATKRRAFVADALAARAEFQRDGLAYRAEDLDAYYMARGRGENPAKPKPVKCR